MILNPTRFDHNLIRFKISSMQQDKKYSEMFEEIDREFFKDDSVSNSNRFSSTQGGGSKKDFSFAVNNTAEM